MTPKEKLPTKENNFFDELTDSMSKHAELSMLDHFAGLAMQAFEARGNYKDIAKYSYDLAEAMIEERRKRHGV